MEYVAHYLFPTMNKQELITFSLEREKNTQFQKFPLCFDEGSAACRAILDVKNEPSEKVETNVHK